MQKFRLTCRGTTALLMHNSRLANPLDDIAKAMKRISGKKRKTDDDYEELARLEHMGGLYFDPDVGPFIPSQNFEAFLLRAARLSADGPKIEQGVFIETDVNPLSYDGPRDLDGLWQDQNFRHIASVKVQRNRVQRTRPHFRTWAVEATGTFDPAIINLDHLREIAVTAGLRIGLGDWRPRFGRFAAEVEKVA